MVAAAVVGSAAIGAVGSSMAADAAGDASAAQTQAASDANALQQQIYDRNTENFQPYLNAGNAGLNALLYRLGLGSGTGGRDMSEQEIRNELRGQYTTSASTGNPPTVQEALQQNGLNDARSRNFSNATWGYDPSAQRWGYQLEYIQGGDAGGTSTQWVYANPTGSTPETVDEAALNAAVQDRLAQQAAAKNDPLYGSLLSSYQAYVPYEKYTPLTDEEFRADPGYQFRLDQGNESIQNMAAATGNLNSGRALKDAMNFSSGLASQEYGNAYGRHVNDYVTGLNSHIQDYNTGFNAFNTNQTNQYNRLAALAGMGQSSASALAGVGQNYANQVGNNLAQSANAQAAGSVAQSNAINQGLGSVANAGLNYAALNNQGAYTSGYTPTSAATGNVNSLYGAWRPVA
jgi:hypothetical protein